MAATVVVAGNDFPEEWGDEVPEWAFWSTAGLLEVVVPQRITTILGFCFPAGLIKITLPDTLVYIGNSAFSGCSELGEVALPPSLLEVGHAAFRNCSGLHELVFPNALADIGGGVCFGCTGLTAVTLPESLVEIADSVFEGCGRLRRISVPDGTETVGRAAFRDCSGLEAVTFSNGVLRVIRQAAFYGCTSLVELALPNSVHTISGNGGSGHHGAFEGCTHLRTLILPAALTALGAAAFRGSTANLQMVVVPQTVPPKVAIAVAAMLCPRTGAASETAASLDSDGGSSFDLVAVVARAGSTLKLVSAPDEVVASLAGIFAAMSTMAEVRAAARHATLLDRHHWTVKTHMHGICTPGQRARAHAVLLVGARLYGKLAQRASVAAAASLAAVVGRRDQTQLPALPDELWVEVLGWLRRCELGE
jgi:hypothetical protein